MHWGDFVSARAATFGELVVGVDPAVEDIPTAFLKPGLVEGLGAYVAAVLEASAGKVGFIKFQSAYFEAFGVGGVQALANAIGLAKAYDLGVILDVKRGDIGTTAAAYARAYLTPKSAGGGDLEADCITINPFLGPDSVEPFVDCARRHGKGLFILVKTSNPGASWLQDQTIDGRTVSDRVADLVASCAEETKGSSGLSAIGAVVGATIAANAERFRASMPDAVMLTPGIGAQGGSPASIAALRRADGRGVLVPISRGVTKVDDRGVAPSAYRAHLESRIAHYKGMLASS
jgi:orotidine-5'-phosphate decarboxylase